MSTECALNSAPNANGTCLENKHIEQIKQYVKANNIHDIKKEVNCDSDSCVLDAINMPINVKDKIKLEALKTEAESLDGNYWMNNTEIDTCMSQMRMQYPGFAHSFIHMSDMKSFPPTNINAFDYRVLPLTSINLPECLKKAINNQSPCAELSTQDNVPIKSIGIVFNTDTSAGSGQHWFAVYISTDTKDDKGKTKIVIEVFNSSGMDIKNNTFQKYWEEQKINIALATGCICEYKLVSTISHQRDDTGNCGSYSLFYIYGRLNGAKSEEFNRPDRKLHDSILQKFRSVCFRVKKNK
jgi:hypothetical protein